jgi:hypothetical protein
MATDGERAGNRTRDDVQRRAGGARDGTDENDED